MKVYTIDRVYKILMDDGESYTITRMRYAQIGMDCTEETFYSLGDGSSNLTHIKEILPGGKLYLGDSYKTAMIELNSRTGRCSMYDDPDARRS